MKLPFPENEAERQAALDRYDIIETPPELPYDDIVALAAYICKTPISVISLLDYDRQWFKARVGLTAQETRRDVSFCGHTILQDGMMVIRDALQDHRFRDNVLVTAEPHIRFYAGAPLVSPDGHKIGVLCVIDHVPRDLDEAQMNALQALSRQVMSQFELRRLMGGLMQLDRMKDDFISTVSHELRTPLTAIRGALGLLSGNAAGKLPQKIKALVGTALHNSDRLIRLINNMLDIHKIKNDGLKLHMEPLDMAAVVQECVTANRPYADLMGVSITPLTSPAPVMVKTDHDCVVQILTNLISNAAKHSPKGGTVEVELHSKGDRVEVAVQDHGDGIPKAFRSQVFKKFSQADNAASGHRKGTGLGLSISKALVECLGGKIGFKTEEKRGTRFFVEIPNRLKP